MNARLLLSRQWRKVTSRKKWPILFLAALLIYSVRTVQVLGTSTQLSRHDAKGFLQGPEEASSRLDSGERPCQSLPVKSVTFTPKEYMENGPGSPFLPLYEKQRKVGRRGLLRVRFVAYYSHSDSNHCQAFYYHIHKNGGSTMNIKENANVDAFYGPREQQLGSEVFANQSYSVLKRIQQIQSTTGTGMPFFTFLRDPVPRFLSSVGQALKLNKLHPCNTLAPGNTTALVDCLLTRISETGSFLDEHLQPQAFELYYGTMGLDLRLQVMDMSAIGRLLEFLGFPVTSSRRQTKNMIHGYNLSTELLTPTLIDRICQLYQMDVALLERTRVSTMCSVSD